MWPSHFLPISSLADLDFKRLEKGDGKPRKSETTTPHSCLCGAGIVTQELYRHLRFTYNSIRYAANSLFLNNDVLERAMICWRSHLPRSTDSCSQ